MRMAGTTTRRWIPGRMPRVNVAALLRAAPGTARVVPVELPELAIAEDLVLAAPVEGSVRLSRTGRSILLRGEVRTALLIPCSRCLVPSPMPVTAAIDEEALPSIDIDSGLPVDTSEEPEAFRIDDHHEIDLDEVVREAVSLAEPLVPLCRPACRGLCPDCGVNRNDDPEHRHAGDGIDPRLAALADLRDRLE